ncbi:MAG: NADH-quinone oxidoreductase subunit K [Leptolinea sp.]|jgi:NADH:ubiquinone oxidoreductase subunit K|nr:NADH-quinone oxidoreductase subunit K [Leptolinea sp.]
MQLSITSLSVIGVLGLIGIGLYALLAANHLIKVIIALQILAKGAILAFVAAGQANGHINTGQSLALTVVVADTIVAVVGLSLAVQARRFIGSMNIRDITSLKR